MRATSTEIDGERKGSFLLNCERVYIRVIEHVNVYRKVIVGFYTSLERLRKLFLIVVIMRL